MTTIRVYIAFLIALACTFVGCHYFQSNTSKKPAKMTIKKWSTDEARHYRIEILNSNGEADIYHQKIFPTQSDTNYILDYSESFINGKTYKYIDNPTKPDERQLTPRHRQIYWEAMNYMVKNTIINASTWEETKTEPGMMHLKIICITLTPEQEEHFCLPVR